MEEFVQSPIGYEFQVGDTVRIMSLSHAGELGELRQIDLSVNQAEYFGVCLDSTQTIVFFAAEDMSIVEAGAENAGKYIPKVRHPLGYI